MPIIQDVQICMDLSAYGGYTDVTKKHLAAVSRHLYICNNLYILYSIHLVLLKITCQMNKISLLYGRLCQLKLSKIVCIMLLTLFWVCSSVRLERQPFKLGVPGSNPGRPTNLEIKDEKSEVRKTRPYFNF